MTPDGLRGGAGASESIGQVVYDVVILYVLRETGSRVQHAQALVGDGWMSAAENKAFCHARGPGRVLHKCRVSRPSRCPTPLPQKKPTACALPPRLGAAAVGLPGTFDFLAVGEAQNRGSKHLFGWGGVADERNGHQNPATWSTEGVGGRGRVQILALESNPLLVARENTSAIFFAPR